MNTRTLGALMGLLLTSACSGDPSCTYPTVAVFSIHYTERIGGTCGPIPDSTQAAGNVGRDPAVTCTGDTDWVVSDNGCARQRMLFCTAGNKAQMEAASIMYAGNDDWVGTFTLTSTSAGCHSVYDVVMVRQ